MKHLYSFLIGLGLCPTALMAQFPGPVGSSGTTAMYKDSSAFVGWATGCTVVRGLQNISLPAGPYASVGDSTMVLGKAGSNGVVSLGDAGMATCRFALPITNGPGPDFAVFENAFNDSFLELAFVEVSSDGAHFVRFPATSNTQDTLQLDNAAVMDATLIDNLAGKYRAMYGTPFDLQELAGDPLLDLNHIAYVRVIDVVGSINPAYATHDQNNRIISPRSL